MIYTIDLSRFLTHQCNNKSAWLYFCTIKQQAVWGSLWNRKHLSLMKCDGKPAAGQSNRSEVLAELRTDAGQHHDDHTWWFCVHLKREHEKLRRFDLSNHWRLSLFFNYMEPMHLFFKNLTVELQHLHDILCWLEKLVRKSHPWHFNPIRLLSASRLERQWIGSSDSSYKL